MEEALEQIAKTESIPSRSMSIIGGNEQGLCDMDPSVANELENSKPTELVN